MQNRSQTRRMRAAAVAAATLLVVASSTGASQATPVPVVVIAASSRELSPQLARRWAELFANLITEFENDGRDVTGLLQGDFSTRKLRLLTTRGEDSGISATLTDRDLANADLSATAQNLYAAWKTIEDSTRGR